jgi:hypothetical protein
LRKKNNFGLKIRTALRAEKTNHTWRILVQKAWHMDWVTRPEKRVSMVVMLDWERVPMSRYKKQGNSKM